MKIIHILILGDGALWIKNFTKFFPKSVYQLDRFHLIRKVKSNFRRKKEDLEEVMKLLEENKIEEVLSIKMKQIIKASIPCNAPSSSPIGKFKKLFSKLQIQEVIYR